MARHLARRTGEALLAVIILTFLVFLSAHATGDPARYLLPPEASATEDLDRLRGILGLDRPLYEQFGIFLRDAAQGDLGTSFVQGRPVTSMLLERLPASIALASTAIVVSVAIALPLGVLAAKKRGGLLDRMVVGISIFGMAVPQFWVGIMLIVVFSTQLGWLPSFGYGRPANLVLPVIALALTTVAGMVRLTRSSMIDAQSSDYVRFARMKGLSESKITWKHALKNALVPVVTFTGIAVGQIFNGAIVIENVFAWPGLGRLTLDAVIQRDFPVLRGAVLFGGLIFVLSAFMVDLVYAWIDPRIREASGAR